MSFSEKSELKYLRIQDRKLKKYVKHRHYERNKRISIDVLGGKTLKETGKKFDLSPARIKQIVLWHCFAIQMHRPTSIRELRRTNFINLIREDDASDYRKSIEIRISFEENSYFAENKRLGIYGTGESIESAISEFLHHFNYFREFYKNKRENEVMGEAAKLREIYAKEFGFLP